MKNLLHIAAILDKPEQLEHIVEKLAFKRYGLGYDEQIVPASCVALETSTVEAYVNGVVTVDDAMVHMDIPFITNFLFTCIKAKNDNYQMTWCSSLS